MRSALHILFAFGVLVLGACDQPGGPSRSHVEELIKRRLERDAPAIGLLRDSPSQFGLCWTVGTVRVIDQQRVGRELGIDGLIIQAEAELHAIVPYDRRCDRSMLVSDIFGRQAAEAPQGRVVVPLRTSMERWDSGWRMGSVSPNLDDARIE